MNDVDLTALVAIFQNTTSLNRLTFAEIVEAIRKIEAAGYTITKPAS